MTETTDPTRTVRMSPSIAALAKALALAQAEMENPPKDSVNPHFKSRYADLATVRDTIIPVLNRRGLSVAQLPCELAGSPALTTLLLHESGEWIETTILLHPIKVDPQGIGSALTYARRYALQSVAGVAADDDDDGNAATRPARPVQQQQPKPAPQPAPADKEPDDPVKGRTAFAALLEAKGQTWAQACVWMNAHLHPAAPYKPEGEGRTKWLEIPENHRFGLVAALRAMPDAAKVGAS